MTIQEMREKRAALVAEARKLTDTAEVEKRELTAEESGRWDTILADVDTLKDDIDKAEAELARRDRVAEWEAELKQPARSTPPRRPIPGEGSSSRVEIPKEIRERWGDFASLPAATRGLYLRRCSAEYEAAFREYLASGAETRELRDLVAGVDTHGGYLAPMQFAARLIRAIDDLLFIRGLSTVYPVTESASLGCPVLATDLNDAEWTGEVTTAPEDTAARFGLREWTPHPLSKLVKVSRKLLRTSAIPVDSLVIQRLAYKFALAQEKAFLTGNGVGKPLGVFVAHASGIPDTRDVATATADAIVGDDLIDALYNLKAQYQARASWVMNRVVVKTIRKIKVNMPGGTSTEYVWQPGLQAGQPDMLLGRPVYMSEHAPSDLTSDNAYLAVVGDFANYWIADGLGMEVQTLAELYAATNHVGYIGRMECDAMPVLGEAFSRLKNKAA